MPFSGIVSRRTIAPRTGLRLAASGGPIADANTARLTSGRTRTVISAIWPSWPWRIRSVPSIARPATLARQKKAWSSPSCSSAVISNSPMVSNSTP
jgi:hypothetical protein